MFGRKLLALGASLVIGFGGVAMAQVAVAAPASAAIPGSSTTSFPVLKLNSSGHAVTVAQYALAHNGQQLSVDGKFGPGTDAAVKAFQRAKGLVADGVIGPKTWAALLSNVQQGSTGNLVKAVQVTVGVSADGVFGSGTRNAVISYQKARGLTADGIVGPATWGAILKGTSGTNPQPPPSGKWVNPHPAQKVGNGGWSLRSAWLRDTIKRDFGLSCTTYKSNSATSDHRTGNGMDCWGTRTQMYNLSRWAASNHSTLKVKYVIFEQRIWQPSNPTWKWMADRGSRTANHYDHVHISVLS